MIEIAEKNELNPPGVRCDFHSEPWLMLLCAAFLGGIFLGAVFGTGASDSLDTQQMRAYIIGFCEKAFGNRFWDCVKFPLLVLGLSTSTVGFLLIPFAVAMRAYFFSCTAASLFTAAGSALLVCKLLLPAAVLTIPCLIYLSVLSMQVSYDHFSLVTLRRPRVWPKKRLLFPGGCALVLLTGAALIEQYLVPALVSTF